jgi:hypothetical protein
MVDLPGWHTATIALGVTRAQCVEAQSAILLIARSLEARRERGVTSLPAQFLPVSAATTLLGARATAGFTRG